MRRRQHRSIRYWQECGGPPESSGRGMQEEIRCRTREAPKVSRAMFKVSNIVETIHTEVTELRPWWEMDWATRTPLNGDGVSYQAYYSEVGKTHHTGKDPDGST